MLDSGELKIELPLHVLLLCVEDLDQLELDIGDGLFLDFESGIHVLFDVFCESEQTLIVVVNLLHELIVRLVQAGLNFVNMLTNSGAQSLQFQTDRFAICLCALL